MKPAPLTPFTAVLSEGPLQLRAPLTERHKTAEAYFPAVGLAEAMDLAMLLGQPLLLTGDPGTGKTRAAYWLAYQLRNAVRVLRYDVKSTSSGTDLLYHFDEVARFRDSTRQLERPLVRYLRFSALGEAILRAAGGDAVLCTSEGEPLEGEALSRNSELLVDAFGEGGRTISGAAKAALLLPDDKYFSRTEPEHLIVLIDELDKAPRDTPNDLLGEIEDMRFEIRELGLQVKADPNFRPIVLVTSNAEKSLPDPFLRRCAYFDIPFPRRYDQRKDGKWPGRGTLEEIVEGRIDALAGGGRLVEEALDLFQRLRRDDAGVRKRPGTAELLAWLDLLVHRHGFGPQDDLKTHYDIVDLTLGSAIKTSDDLEAARRIVAEWSKAGR